MTFPLKILTFDNVKSIFSGLRLAKARGFYYDRGNGAGGFGVARNGEGKLL